MTADRPLTCATDAKTLLATPTCGSASLQQRRRQPCRTGTPSRNHHRWASTNIATLKMICATAAETLHAGHRFTRKASTRAAKERRRRQRLLQHPRASLFKARPALQAQARQTNLLRNLEPLQPLVTTSTRHQRQRSSHALRMLGMGQRLHPQPHQPGAQPLQSAQDAELREKALDASGTAKITSARHFRHHLQHRRPPPPPRRPLRKYLRLCT